MSRRWCGEVSLAERVFTLEVDDSTFTFSGDPVDGGRVHVAVPGYVEPLEYFLWPDITAWRLTDKGKALYAKEFEGIPGWRERALRVGVDAIGDVRRGLGRRSSGPGMARCGERGAGCHGGRGESSAIAGGTTARDAAVS